MGLIRSKIENIPIPSSGTRQSIGAPVRAPTSRAVGPTALPELAEFFAQFLAGRGPVALDSITELRNVSFDFEFVLFEPGHVELLSGGASFELPADVLFVISHNPTRVNC